MFLCLPGYPLCMLVLGSVVRCMWDGSFHNWQLASDDPPHQTPCVYCNCVALYTNRGFSEILGLVSEDFVVYFKSKRSSSS